MHAGLADHLRTSHGVVSVGELRTIGLTRHQLARLVAHGDLVRVHRGVYRHAAMAVTWDLRLRAGLLAVGVRAVVSHRAAVAVHGVRGFRCDLVELTTTASSAPRIDGARVHRTTTLAPADLRRVDGWRVTSPARTLVDTADVLPIELVQRWAQEWIADRKVRVEVLAAAAGRAGNRPGAHLLAAHAGELIADVDSTREADLGRILADGGLPPELHVLVTTPIGSTYELDWAYPSHRIGLEMDGYGVHLRSVVAFDHDRFRRNELEIAGWTILNFTSRQCRRPSVIVDQVRRALARSSSAAA